MAPIATERPYYPRVDPTKAAAREHYELNAVAGVPWAASPLTTEVKPVRN